MKISSRWYFSIIHYTKCWSNTSRNVSFFIFPCIIPSFSWSLISSEPGFKYIGFCPFWLLEVFWLPSDQGPHSFHLFSLQILLLKGKMMVSSQHAAFYFPVVQTSVKDLTKEKKLFFKPNKRIKSKSFSRWECWTFHRQLICSLATEI